MAGTRPTILLVDDDPAALDRMQRELEGEFDCLRATDTGEASALMQEHFVQVAVVDQSMQGGMGTAFLSKIRASWPETVRILVGRSDSDAMLSAINDAGVYQFLPKPCHPDQLRIAARAAAKLFQLARDNDRMMLEIRCRATASETKLESERAALRAGPGFEAVLRAPTSPLNAIVEVARRYATFDVPVLITGEAATGKRQLARAMHYASLRSDRPFFELNCVGLTEAMVELELFGARNGSVPTGQKSKIGLVQKADRGTLFLNGVHMLSCRLQMMLLRLLRERAFNPVGGHETQTSNVRLICAAPPTLPDLVREIAFSPELFYAISVTAIDLPPLRERPMDIPLIARGMLLEAAAQHSKPVHGFTEPALEFLAAYDWPGNIRELGNEVTRMLIFSQEKVLGPELISRHILQADPHHDSEDREAETVMAKDGTLKDRVEHIESRILRETLTRHKWNKSRAAAELGLSRVGLRAKLERYGVAPPEDTRELEEG